MSCESIADPGRDASRISGDNPARSAHGSIRFERSDAALAGLAGSALADRFRSWRGVSGRRYVFSIFRHSNTREMASVLDFADAVVIAAARDQDGTRRIVHIADTGGCPDLFFKGRALAEAHAAGATELHVHLLASSRAERGAVIADLYRPG